MYLQPKASIILPVASLNSFTKQCFMKCIQHLLLFLFLPIAAIGQQLTLIAPLQDEINETSGLIFLNQRIITHNDSGGEPVLYELDSISGNITRRVLISNAVNIDWEDICNDDEYIYIADIGNNRGSRTDLKVYRVSIVDYFQAANDTVSAEIIHFNYADQTDFTATTYSTNFDAEAIISYNDSLYIFTKNWGNSKSNIYSLPKSIGIYTINKIDSIDSQGLVTGAVFNPLSNSIMLSAYAYPDPIIIEISNVIDNQFSNGIINRQLLQMPIDYSYQIEAIAFINESQYYVTSEESFSGSSGLFKLDYQNTVNVENREEKSALIFPNPASNMIYVEYPNFARAEIYDMQGRLQKTFTHSQISISDLTQGVYLIILENTKGDRVSSRKLIIN